MAKPKLELVIWEDPASDFDGWTAISKVVAAEAELVMSIGWVAREDDHYLFLAMDYHDDNVNTLGKIPKTAVRARKEIKPRWPKVEEKNEDS